MTSSSAILFITAFHPSGRGFIGAGEAISGETLDTLLNAGKAVHVLCLAPANQFANPEMVARCKSYKVLEQTTWQSLSGIVMGFRYGSALAPWFFTRSAKRNIAALQSIIAQLEPSEIWLDFPSVLGFLPYLPGRNLHYFVHDVVSQKIARRGLLKWVLPAIQKVEQSLLTNIRQCVVLSEKDEALLRGLGFKGELSIRPPQGIKPGRVDDGMQVEQLLEAFRGSKNLVFFGNMRRIENHASVMHFLLWGYPSIRRSHKDVKFWILGLSPRWSLRLLAKFLPGVNIVGAVDDPNPAFKAATLCIAPLRLGAGVKIKVLQMLNAGAIVVSSPIGAEGISPTPNLKVVPYNEIPNMVCQLLDNNNALRVQEDNL